MAAPLRRLRKTIEKTLLARDRVEMQVVERLLTAVSGPRRKVRVAGRRRGIVRAHRG